MNDLLRQIKQNSLFHPLKLNTMKTLAKTLAIVALLVSSAATQANNPNLPKGIIYQIEIEATDIQKSNDVILEYAYLRKISLNNNLESSVLLLKQIL